MAKNTVRQDEKLNEIVKRDIIKRLYSYLKPYKFEVFQVLVLMGVVIGVNLLNPYFFRLGIDEYIANKDIKGLFLLGGLVILINIVSMICSRWRIKKMARITNNILVTIRHQLYEHIQKLSFEFFDNRPNGKIIARIIGDVNSLNNLFTSSVTNLIPDLVTLIAVVVIMISMNLKLALVSLVTLPFLLVFMFLVEVTCRKRWQLFRKKNSNMKGYIYENFSGIRVVQSFAAQDKTSRGFSEILAELNAAFIKAAKASDLFWPLVEISWGVGSVIVFWYGVKLLNTGEISVGLLVAFISYISMFWRPIMNLSNFYNNLITNMAAAERIFEIMDIKPDIEDKKCAKTMPKIKGNVVFRHVNFSYDDNEIVLKDINFSVKAGETIALVGPTGAGKTTIVNLIARFYDVDSGEVLIDGYNVSDVRLETLRSQMGIMLQDTFLFSGTIKENIRYGKLDATDEEIIKAAKAAYAHDFIMKLPNGYDTDINERGTRLSVGQRQLIAFARALLADPRILILDEATSSIDTHTERLVQKGIERLLKGRTSFVIAHRLSTIQNADRIFVIDDGRIKEMGNHDELMRMKGIYYNLFMSQFKFLDNKKAV
ncbi:ATP-binding cassette, subfamily B [Caloranaerobacter azorensis DSM 13643]|uniref:ATP-binding cassette, subfamily B n=1 Tax=Caloranaerobacter azorensis DSM 13643 TaxID=1121264 RepID=A0A1M5WKC1_9FIRM|nr:ABC transporter ATP-binding protein [Caloranaerobacter azorensis]SHH87897.1 ATP-binding cassette, subfamily B [Caloranaerobacter azorensis DSM 13643]